MHSQQKGSSVWSNPFCSGDTVGTQHGVAGSPQGVPGATSPTNSKAPAKAAFKASPPISVCFPILPRRRLLTQTLLSRTPFYISFCHRCWWLWRLRAAEPAPPPTWQPRRKATGVQAAGLPSHPALHRGCASAGRGCAQPRHQPPVLSGCYQQCWVLGWLQSRNKVPGVNQSV